ncbi:MAG: hypothetical protein QOF24_1517 [Verrucomicrobiota bacterium]|jgi:hypothetical protein
MNFRNGFFAGLVVALIVGIYFVRLWQPDRQVTLHAAHLLSHIENKDWTAVSDAIADDYQDRWGNDRALVLERLREVFRAMPSARIAAGDPAVQAESGKGNWVAKVTITGTGEFAAVIEERVNALPAPFEMEWRRRSAKPWDWKLVRVENPALEISGL